MFRLVRQAVLVVAPRKDFRVVHMSVQGNHIHLICEAASAPALASGLKGFKTSLARRINGAKERHGAVFADRYHVESLSSVRHVRNAICYVLNNWRKHQDDRDAVSWIDPFSTACHFDGWVERDRFRYRQVDAEDILPKCAPRTWLLREGWKRGAPTATARATGTWARATDFAETAARVRLLEGMKKTSNKRLAITKVTVAPLSAEALERVAGGQPASGVSCGDVCEAISRRMSCVGACATERPCISVFSC